MEDGVQDPARDTFAEVAALRSEIEELRRKEQKYMEEKEDSENEFGKKRALFRELYMTREEELKKEKNNAKCAREEAERLREELRKMAAESDGFRTASAISREDELEAMQLKHKEEIASLQHIMRETVRDAEAISVQTFQEERQQFVSRIQSLTAQITELQGNQGHSGEGTGPGGNVLSSAMNAVSNAVRRNTHLGGSSSSLASAEASEDEVLERSMKKAQEDAETLRNIVMPLEQEIATLKEKLKESQKRLHSAEAKIKASANRINQNDPEKPANQVEKRQKSSVSEDTEDKVKELTQYLEAERSSRTDLEMYVAVLNTQKGVLQEDAERLREEMRNVCRLYEQERTSHRELKQTWQLANDQFLANQRLQDAELRRVRSMLTADQLHGLQGLQPDEPPTPDVGHLISFDSPDASPSSTSLESRDAPLPEPSASSSSLWNSIPTVPCTSALAVGSAGSLTDQDGSEPGGMRRVHSASDVKSLGVSGSEVPKAKSAEDLSSSNDGSPTPDDQHRRLMEADGVLREVPLQGAADARPRLGSAGAKIDWKIFQEEVKVSHQSGASRACAMCVNYERQLQAMQKSQNLATNLQRALDKEKKALFEEQKQRRRLEESILRSAEDAQAQITAHVAAQTKLEKQLTDVKQKFAGARKDALSRIETLVKSRNELEAELHKLRTEYSSLQDNAIQQLSQMDSDSRLSELREHSAQIRAAAEHTEEKLRSEIAFLKDRAMAEQMAKDSLEEVFQGDLDGLRAELSKVKDALTRETSVKLEVEAQLSKAQELQKNTEKKSQQVVIALRSKVDDANAEKLTMEQENKKLKNQLQSLNQQLNESEAVQKDFVCLSQSLQMQIASIQESEAEVRWVHPDDVSECRKCKRLFNSPSEKHHCDHCGKIFCEECSSKTATRSTSNRAHRVCDMCHTSLNKDSKSTFFDVNLADSQT